MALPGVLHFILFYFIPKRVLDGSVDRAPQYGSPFRSLAPC